MTGLLTAAAVITTLTLLVSGTNALSRATASDSHKRGPWGIASWAFERNRSLNPHQRRWQTVLISGRDNESRWSDLVAEIQLLEKLSNTPGITPVPSSHSNQWIEASLANLERATSSDSPAGGTTP